MKVSSDLLPAATHEPPPKPGTRNIFPLVMADFADRRRMGELKYKTPLQAHNGRDALMDAYQEAMDLCLYLRQAIYERDNPKE